MFYGEESDDVQEVIDGICVDKGIFIKLLEGLNLQKTEKVYIHYLFCSDDEIKHPTYKGNVSQEDVITSFYNEIDSKGLQNKLVSLEER